MAGLEAGIGDQASSSTDRHRINRRFYRTRIPLQSPLTHPRQSPTAYILCISNKSNFKQSQSSISPKVMGGDGRERRSLLRVLSQC